MKNARCWNLSLGSSPFAALSVAPGQGIKNVEQIGKGTEL